jgi:excisionase family DNA binding protein
MKESGLLTVPESATFSRLKESTIRKWVLQGRLPYVKLGRRVFIRSQDLDSLIAASLVPARKGVSTRAE